jgi:hypothetical protein
LFVTSLNQTAKREVCECSDVAYLEAEKEKLEIKRQEWVERVNIATNTIRVVYFEEMLKEVDSQLKYVEQRLSELRKPAELLGGMDEEAEIPPSKMPSSEKLLGGMDEEAEIPPSKMPSSEKLLGGMDEEAEIPPSKMPSSEKLLGGMDEEAEIPPSKMPSSEKLLGGMDEEAEIPPSKNSPSRRRKGEGTGYIYWRTVRRGAKTYQQAYYHYEVYQEGNCLIKSSKYIPKGKLVQVQQLNNDKVPVREILELLGKGRRRHGRSQA